MIGTAAAFMFIIQLRLVAQIEKEMNEEKQEIIQMLNYCKSILNPQFDIFTLQSICLLSHCAYCNRQIRSHEIEDQINSIAQCMVKYFKKHTFAKEVYECYYPPETFLALLDNYDNEILHKNLSKSIDYLKRQRRIRETSENYCPKFVILAAMTSMPQFAVICSRNQYLLDKMEIYYKVNRKSENSFINDNISDSESTYSDLQDFII